jgi:WD40 repeat protein
MLPSATAARAQKLVLGTLLVLSAAALMVAVVAVAPRAWGQGPSPKAKPAPDEPSPSDTPPGKAKNGNETPAALPAGAIRRLGRHPRQKGPPAGHTGALNSLVFSPDGARLASWGGDEEGPQLRMWEAATGKELYKLDGMGPMAFTLDGKQLVSRSSADLHPSEEEVLLWDLSTQKARARIPLKLLSIAHMPADGNECVLLCQSGEAAYIDLATAKIKKTKSEGWGLPLSLSHDGIWLATTRRPSSTPLKEGETKIYLSELPSSREGLGEMRGKQGHILAGSFSPEPLTSLNTASEERLFAAGGYDNLVHVWDVRSPQRLNWVLSGHASRVLRLAFSPCGRFLVSTSIDGSIRVWDLMARKGEGAAVTINESVVLHGHIGYATPVAFSPDGRIMATGGNNDDRTIVLWDFWKAVLGQPGPGPAPSEAKLQALWNDLASDGPGPQGLLAVGTLMAAPDEAMGLMRRQIDPYVQEAQRDRIMEWIAQLDDGQYAVREAATEALIRLRRQADGLLRTALRNATSPEARFRLRRILSAGNSTPSISPTEVRRFRRVVLLLERLASADARKLLEHLSEVFPSPEVNRDAREALARLSK